jgi:L-methionine (R)-S-oxide reductase
MSVNITAKGSGKVALYESLINPLTDLLSTEEDIIANMANVCSVLKETFHFFWVGFYLVRGKELVLGPFQGSLACTRIGYGKGVCGTAWKEKKPILVDDVDLFPNHIACSNLSKSEIVVPLFFENEVWAVLDIDSDQLSAFDKTDEEYLLKLMKLIQKR